jgi:UDP-N-acetylglucosamine 2-epimerase
MKVLTVVGARPQFIKCAPLSRALRGLAREVLVHTGQHYDDAMSGVFFRELDIPEPDYSLGVGSGPHGRQTGEMLAKIEDVIVKERPDLVLVYGDTNTTLAGALAAAKLHIPVAHVEAGLRSYKRSMPEEINRLVTDRLSTLLLCPTDTAVANLKQEGLTKGVHLVGDVMYDALMDAAENAQKLSNISERYHLRPKQYVLATVHRAENTDDSKRLQGIVHALVEIARAGHTVVFPVHPRTLHQLRKLSIPPTDRFLQIEPVSFLDMIALESIASHILTDSGGMQKEAYWLQVPCLTLRDETEWIETVESGWNHLVGADTSRVLQAFDEAKPSVGLRWPWNPGEASHNVAQIIRSGAWA